MRFIATITILLTIHCSPFYQKKDTSKFKLILVFDENIQKNNGGNYFRGEVCLDNNCQSYFGDNREIYIKEFFGNEPKEVKVTYYRPKPIPFLGNDFYSTISREENKNIFSFEGYYTQKIEFERERNQVLYFQYVGRSPRNYPLLEKIASILVFPIGWPIGAIPRREHAIDVDLIPLGEYKLNSNLKEMEEPFEYKVKADKQLVINSKNSLPTGFYTFKQNSNCNVDCYINKNNICEFIDDFNCLDETNSNLKLLRWEKDDS